MPATLCECLQPYAIEATAACIQAATPRVQVIGAEDDATELLTIRSPLSPSASWAGVTARYVRIWMVSPAAALRDAPASLGYSIYELRACAHPAAQPGVPTGRCAAAAEAKGLHVFHFEVCTCTLHVHCMPTVCLDATPRSSASPRALRRCCSARRCSA